MQMNRCMLWLLSALDILFTSTMNKSRQNIACCDYCVCLDILLTSTPHVLIEQQKLPWIWPIIHEIKHVRLCICNHVQTHKHSLCIFCRNSRAHCVWDRILLDVKLVCVIISHTWMSLTMHEIPRPELHRPVTQVLHSQWFPPDEFILSPRIDLIMLGAPWVVTV